MKNLLLLSFIFSSTSFAALSIKPGLWNIEVKMNKDGKVTDPHAKMAAAMAKMSPEQNKQMQAMMAKMSAKAGYGEGGSPFGFGEHGLQVCYTNEMLKNAKLPPIM